MTIQRQVPFRTLCDIAVVFSLFAAPTIALAAPTKDQCVDANTEAQNLKRDGKLLSSRLALRSCADLACPKRVQVDCTKRLDELEQSIPSVVFDAKDGSGRDLSAVTVMIDDKPLVDHLDGTPIEIDPGAHVFTFKVLDQPPVTRSLVIQQGERDRRESITIGAPPTPSAPGQTAPAVVAPPAAASSAESPAPQPGASPAQGVPPIHPDGPANGASSTRKTLGWTAIGVGAAGLVIGGISGALAISKKKSIDDDPACRGNACPPGEMNVNGYDSLRTVSSYGFIAGGVFAATGVVLLLTAPSPSQNAALWLGPGSAGVMGRFE